jgi:GNAT acetyltransferase-like protein
LREFAKVMLILERLAPDQREWERMDALPDRLVFQTQAWLRFVEETQPGTEAVVAAVRRDGETVGYFTGLIARRFGVRILGSPFPGWTTGPMGFNLLDGAGRREALAALPPFAFRELGCLHLEIKDRQLGEEDFDGMGFRSSPFVTLEIDLDREEEEIFGGMSSACRRAIRKSQKVGLTVEEASGEGFADEYYAQLEDVFAKQGLTPPYDVERVRALIRCLEPTGRLLLLRAISSDGDRVATGIFPGMNHSTYFWGGASWRSGQILRPNEAIFWYAIRHWRDRGGRVMDLGGGGDYKLKFGPRSLTVPWARKARVPGLLRLRDLAEVVYRRAAMRR